MEHNSEHTLHSVNKVTSTIWAHFFSRASRLFRTLSSTFVTDSSSWAFLFIFGEIGKNSHKNRELFFLFPREILFDHLPFQCTWRSFIFYTSFGSGFE